MTKEQNSIMLCMYILLAIILTADVATAQRRMLSTQSYSQAIRKTNPPEINGIGKIDGTETRRSKPPPSPAKPVDNTNTVYDPSGQPWYDGKVEDSRPKYAPGEDPVNHTEF